MSAPETAPAEPISPANAPLDKSGARVREMFRQIAPRYDAMNHLLSLNIDRWWRNQAVKRLQVLDQSPILDICTGTGDLAFAIQRAHSDIKVIGSDFCFDMLRFARQKNSAANIPFLEADAQSLPFADDQFQCVTVAFGLRNVADTDRGLQEMTRVCRPGGQVMVLEFSSPTLPVLKQSYGFYFQHVLPKVGQLFAKNDKSAYQYLPESVGQFPSGQALLDRFTAAGLEKTTAKPLTCGVATIYQGFKPR